MDPDFLECDEARPIRILAEYLEPLRRLKEQNIQDTVVFFGSARVHSRQHASSAIANVRRRTTRRGREYTAALKRSRKALEWSRYYEEARQVANRLSKWSRSLESPRHRFVVCSGGGPGIMEAANRGAHEAGAKSLGFNIRLPFEQGPNRYITKGLHFEFHYFFMRKFWFAYLAKALIVFPGGFGTLDEMFEIVTLAQTQKLSKQISVFMYGREYWDQVMDLDVLADWGAISRADLGLLHWVDTPDEAFEQLRAHLLTYHVTKAKDEDCAPEIAKTRV